MSRPRRCRNLPSRPKLRATVTIPTLRCFATNAVGRRLSGLLGTYVEPLEGGWFGPILIAISSCRRLSTGLCLP